MNDIPLRVVVAFTVIVLGFLGAVTALVLGGKDYQSVVVLIGSITTAALSVATLVKTNTVATRVNGHMTTLIDRATVNANNPTLVNPVSSGNVVPQQGGSSDANSNSVNSGNSGNGAAESGGA